MIFYLRRGLSTVAFHHNIRLKTNLQLSRIVSDRRDNEYKFVNSRREMQPPNESPKPYHIQRLPIHKSVESTKAPVSHGAHYDSDAEYASLVWQGKFCINHW